MNNVKQYEHIRAPTTIHIRRHSPEYPKENERRCAQMVFLFNLLCHARQQCVTKMRRVKRTRALFQCAGKRNKLRKILILTMDITPSYRITVYMGGWSGHSISTFEIKYVRQMSNSRIIKAAANI